MKKIKIGVRTYKIELEKNESMCIYWERLSKERADIIAYAHEHDEIIVEYFKSNKNQIMSLQLKNVLLFNVNFYIRERGK